MNRNTYFKTNTFFAAWLACCCTAASHAQLQTTAPVPALPALPAVTVIAPAYKLAADQTLQASPAAIGKIFDIDLERDVSGARRLEDVLVESGLAYWDASNSLGLSTGVGFRGFALSNQGNQQLQGSRAYLNGHPDIVWRFARDPATVARVQVLQGNDATLLGAGSPGGTVQYLSKTPVGTESLRLQLGANSASGSRLSLDAEKHVGIFQVRTVLAAQRGERTLEGVVDNRSAALVATKLPWATGEARLDLEHHENSLPFPFGTAYAGQRFWLDKPYVDQRASAQRQYSRQALYVRQELSNTTTLNAYWQRVRSSRDETLVGFFDVLNATKLRGYYRLIKEENAQSDAGLKVNGGHDFANFGLGTQKSLMTHRWTVAYSTSSQNRAFSGPQNIGGFTLDLANPLFPANLAALTLSPRFVFESYRERGLGASSVWQLNNFELRVGLRRSAIEIDSATSPNLLQVRVADSAQNTASVGLGYALPDSQRLWLSFAESFQPNRGTLSGGAYLPPSLGQQRELGWERTWAGDTQSGKASLQAFDVLQSNLPRRDPRDPDAFVLIGAVRSTGISAALDLQHGPFAFKTALTQQHARVLNVSAAQGNELIGVPARFGSASVSVKSSVGLWALQAQGASSLAGDASASFRASGYVVYGLRWQAPLAADTKHQLQWGARLDNALDRRYVRALTGADNVWQGQRRKLTVWAEVPF